MPPKMPPKRPPRSRDEEICAIPASRTMNAAQYANSIAGTTGPRFATPTHRRISSNTGSSSAGSPSSPTPGSRLTPNRPLKRSSANAFDVLSPEIPKQLMLIFIDKAAPVFLQFIIHLNELQDSFDRFERQGNLSFETVDMVVGLCLAIGSLLSSNSELWNARQWYEAASDKLHSVTKHSKGIGYFQARILQIKYLQMSGEVKHAWEIVSLSIGEAQSLGMHLSHHGSLAVDNESKERLRAIWQYMRMAKLSLALQLGHGHEVFDVRLETALPTRAWLEKQGKQEWSTYLSHVVPDSFFALVAIGNRTDDFLELEADVRPTGPGCVYQWAAELNLSEFTGLNNKLIEWKNKLPIILKWHSFGVDSTEKADPVLCQMRMLVHLQHVSLRLRQYRAMMVVAMRLLRPCTCQDRTHVFKEDIITIEGAPNFHLIRGATIQCLVAAQFIIKSLWTPAEGRFDEAMIGIFSSETIDLIYSAALVLVAARSIGLVVKHVEPNVAKSVSTLTEHINQAEVMLQNYQELCGQCPSLGQRIGRVRDFLSRASRQSSDSTTDGMPGMLSDGDLQTRGSVWTNLYSRLGVAFDPYEPDDPVPGQEALFCWAESLSVDFD